MKNKKLGKVSGGILTKEQAVGMMENRADNFLTYGGDMPGMTFNVNGVSIKSKENPEFIDSRTGMVYQVIDDGYTSTVSGGKIR